jgi:hypothetical protein
MVRVTEMEVEVTELMLSTSTSGEEKLKLGVPVNPVPDTAKV